MLNVFQEHTMAAANSKQAALVCLGHNASESTTAEVAFGEALVIIHTTACMEAILDPRARQVKMGV